MKSEYKGNENLLLGAIPDLKVGLYAPRFEGELGRRVYSKFFMAKLYKARQTSRLWGENMLSKIPINLREIKKEDMDKEILRAGIIAELDAINLYEQMAAMTGNRLIKEVLLDIAKEEKTHVGEFQAMLLKEDKEQVEELEKGREEVDERKH